MFLELKDGSCRANLQIIVDEAVANLSPLVATRTHMVFEGLLKVTKQKMELWVNYVIRVDPVDSIPLTLDLLGDRIYFRPRTNTIGELYGKKCPIMLAQQYMDPWLSDVNKKRKLEEWEVSTGELKLEMAEIRADQKRMREGQMEVREKFKEIKRQCAQLSEETNLISQQNKGTILRLILLSKISQAREHKDFVKARKLTNCLRELIASQNEKESAIKMTTTSTKD